MVRPLPGLVITAGGKYTTYRLMARDSIDVAARDLERPVPPSCTEHVPLLGAGGYRAIADGLEEVAAASAMPPASVERLLGRYGSAVRDIVALVARRPELSEPLEGAADHLAAEVVYAASHEGALHLEDVLTRRTRISIETWDRGLAAAEPAARLLSGVLEWSEEQRRRRSITTACASRPKERPRSSRTTSSPTPSGGAPRTSSPSSLPHADARRDRRPAATADGSRGAMPS